MERKDIKHIAEIAKIYFTEEELLNFEKDFVETMNLVNEITKIDTKDAETLFQVNNTVNNLRKDEIRKSLSQEEATMNTEGKKYGYFDIIKFVK